MEETIFQVPKSIKLFYKISFPFKLGILDKIYGKWLSNRGICWVKTPVGNTWKLDLNMVTHRWILYESYSCNFLNWAKNNIPANGVVVDSGANIGQMTLYFAKWFNEGKVLAFEPDLEAYKWLSECIYKNHNQNVELIKKGLGDKESSAVLIVPEDGKDKNLHAFWSFISTKSVDGQVISLTTLEEELQKRNIKEVDLWKLDVEGYELPALKGAESLLKSHKIKAIYSELAIKEMNHVRIYNYLSDLGYHCHFFDSLGKLYPAKKMLDYQTDGLFLPK